MGMIHMACDRLMCVEMAGVLGYLRWGARAVPAPVARARAQPLFRNRSTETDVMRSKELLWRLRVLCPDPGSAYSRRICSMDVVELDAVMLNGDVKR